MVTMHRLMVYKLHVSVRKGAYSFIKGYHALNYATCLYKQVDTGGRQGV